VTTKEKLRLFDEATARLRKRSHAQDATAPDDRGWTREDLYEGLNPARYNEDVPRDAAELLKDALALSPEVRAALADSLLASLDVEVDEGAEDLWREEIRRRLEEIDQGAVKLISWDNARRHLRERLQR
jgi:putative addiction module component (TIGR02574 family)